MIPPARMHLFFHFFSSSKIPPQLLVKLIDRCIIVWLQLQSIETKYCKSRSRSQIKVVASHSEHA